MRAKPGAGFGFQPTDTLAAPDTPTFHRKQNQPAATAAPIPASKTPDPSAATNATLTQSYYNLIRSTTAVPPVFAPAATHSAMSRSRSASFSDDDLMIVGSQAMSSQGYDPQGYGSQEQINSLLSSPLRPISVPNDVIDITSSPVAHSLSPSKNSSAGSRDTYSTFTAATQQPVFGRPTQSREPRPSPSVLSSAAAAAMAAQRRQNSIFNANANRPEHHRPQRLTGPLAPKKPDRKAAPRPMFSSLGPTQPSNERMQPAASLSGNVGSTSNIDSNPYTTSASSLSHANVDFYTDPDKATADLKALLEGGMDDDEDEEEPAAPGTTGVVDGDKPAEEAASTKKKEKKVANEYDDGSIEGINVKLLPHQVEGVKWMRGRELGPVKRGRVPKGGILADDMGLGKTLQSIAVIMTNPKPAKDAPGWKKHYEKIDGATLVVAPLALIRQWEAEIKEKVAKNKPLRVCVHHGPQRTVRPQDLMRFDVVITTYQILVSEHGHSNDTLKSGCFGVNWFRVILDEAHSIKNRNAKMTKACCALSTEFRWCLTGTPMQNNLDELQSLVNFLRITPYDNLAEWRAHIDAPLKNGRGYLAIRRLHSLLQCFMKRRTKDILKEEGALVPGGKKAIDAAAAAAEEAAKSGSSGSSAPGHAATPAAPRFKITERNVVSVLAEFSPAERAFYDRLEERADKSLEKMMQGKSVSYANALVLLLRLRQACNHPKLLDVKLEADKDAMSTDPVPASQKSAATDADIDSLTDVFGGLGIATKKCEVCMTDLTKAEMQGSEATGGGMLCSDCVGDRDMLDGMAVNKAKSKKSAKIKKHKKSKTSKHRAKEAKSVIKIDDGSDVDNSVIDRKKLGQRKAPRNRRAIIDSDDEDEDEDGSWLVDGKERGALRLGKAGGSDDENAEGGGDWINSDDSAHQSEDEDSDASRLSSFVVDDEKGDAAERKLPKNRVVHVPGESDESDESDSSSDFNSDSEGSTEASEDDASDLYSNIDTSFLGRRPGMRKTDASTTLLSAKIRKMLSILRDEADEHKFIIFSQFTTMLDLISPFLERASLSHVRYDGRMRNDAREASLKSLREDPRTRVLLCSLKCGALGLNLTAATRVIILEPFWNPFVEEQAIDRVHRLTQTVDVTVYKLTVADTVEQRILALQDKKRLLAAQTLEAGSTKRGGKKEALKLGLKELMDLFKHDARDGGVAQGAGDVDARAVEDLVAFSSQGSDGGLLRRRVGDGGASQSGASSFYQASQDSAYSRRW